MGMGNGKKVKHQFFKQSMTRGWAVIKRALSACGECDGRPWIGGMRRQGCLAEHARPLSLPVKQTTCSKTEKRGRERQPILIFYDIRRRTDGPNVPLFSISMKNGVILKAPVRLIITLIAFWKNNLAFISVVLLQAHPSTQFRAGTLG